jgi:hypothetical protein
VPNNETAKANSPNIRINMIDPPLGLKGQVFQENEEFIVTAGKMPTTLAWDSYALQVRMSSEKRHQ